MDRLLRHNFSFLHCSPKRSVFAFLWVGGMILGAVLSLSADTLLVSTMHAAVHSSMSISGLLISILLPLFLTALTVSISQPMLLFPIVFLKAFLYSYIRVGLLVSFDVAGWLLQMLLMFSETLTLPLLWYCWLRAASDDRRAAFRCALICTFFAVGIGCFDYAFVVPFLARLI